MDRDGFGVLDSLYGVVSDRLEEKPRGSYTWSIASRGVEYVARKVAEEAVETLIEALRGDREGVIREASDLLYHLVVLLAMCGVKPGDIGSELRRRMK